MFARIRWIEKISCSPYWLTLLLLTYILFANNMCENYGNTLGNSSRNTLRNRFRDLLHTALYKLVLTRGVLYLRCYVGNPKGHDMSSPALYVYIGVAIYNRPRPDHAPTTPSSRPGRSQGHSQDHFKPLRLQVDH